MLHNQLVIDTNKRVNDCNKTIEFTSLYFLSLYTNIPHGKLIRILNEHIVIHSEVHDGKLVMLHRYGAQWSYRQRPGSIPFTWNSLRKTVTYLFDS